ncbi:uncharacterized protein [Cherax quadricarinatus]
MALNSRRRINTVCIEMIRGAVSGSNMDLLLPAIIRDTYGIANEEICGVALNGTTRIFVKMTSARVYEAVVDKNVPFEATDFDISSELRNYGTVHVATAGRWATGPYAGTLEGTYTVKMTLRHPIPSYVVLKELRTQVYVTYAGQRHTCRLCGSYDHIAAQCGKRSGYLAQQRQRQPVGEVSDEREQPLATPPQQRLSWSEEVDKEKELESPVVTLQGESQSLDIHQVLEERIPIMGEEVAASLVKALEVLLEESVLDHVGDPGLVLGTAVNDSMAHDVLSTKESKGLKVHAVEVHQDGASDVQMQGQLSECYAQINANYPVIEIESLKEHIRNLQNERFDGGRLKGGIEEVLLGDRRSACVLRSQHRRRKAMELMGLSVQRDRVLGAQQRMAVIVLVPKALLFMKSDGICVFLLPSVAPQRVRITGLSEPLLAGHPYRVGCETSGSRPAPILTWTIKRPDRLEEVLATQDLSKRNVSRSWLELKLSWTDHGATLRCSAASPALQDRVVSNSSVFDVHFPPRLHLALGRMLQPDGIKEEMDVYFHCSVTANPKVYKITWYHNNKEVHQDASGGVLVSDDHLVLQKIKRRWSGTYVCKASNVVGDSASNALTITVQYAPICASASTAVFRAALGEEIVLPCRVLSHPINVSFSWTFMNTLTEHERVPGDRVSWQGLESRLRYLPEKTQDYGTLHCWASNRVGHQKEPCVFTIKPAGVPSPPLNCTVSNQTWESVEVTCGDPGGALAHHHQQQHHQQQHHQQQHHRTGHGYDYTRSGYDEPPVPSNPAELLQDKDKPRYLLTVQERLTRAVVHNVTGERGMFSVSGLTPGLDYVISVVRYNSHGRSSNVTLEAFTLRTAENRMREEDEGSESALLGVVLGVMGVVLLLAAGAIAITLRSRSRPRCSTPTETTRLPPGEASDSTGLDHPDLLEGETHAVTAAGYRKAEVTQALLSPSVRPVDEEMSLKPTSVSPTTSHLDYLPCEGSDNLSPNVRSHPRLYVRAEGLASQQESFL